jgi:hypothetical protein
VKYLRTAVVVALAAATVAPLAHAQNIMQRDEMQMRQLDRAVHRGEISPAQYRNLMRGQQHIQNMEQRAMADGMMTPHERRMITQAQDIQSHRLNEARGNVY